MLTMFIKERFVEFVYDELETCHMDPIDHINERMVKEFGSNVIEDPEYQDWLDEVIEQNPILLF